MSPDRVGVALLSQAVTSCCFFPRGWSSGLWRVTDISRYRPQLLGTHPGHISVSGWLARPRTAHGVWGHGHSLRGSQGTPLHQGVLRGGVGQSNMGAAACRWVLRAPLFFQVGSLASWDSVVSVPPLSGPFLGCVGVHNPPAPSSQMELGSCSPCLSSSPPSREAPQDLRRSPGCPGL